MGIGEDVVHPVRVMALGGRFKWNDQGQTPNTMFGIAEYANGQQVFFNVRNVNYKGYKKQVMNEYYFEDGSKITGGKYYAKGSDKGEALKLPPGKVTPGGNWGAFIAACRAGKPEMANGTMPERARLLRAGPPHEQLLPPGHHSAVQREGRPIRRQQGGRGAFPEAA